MTGINNPVSNFVNDWKIGHQEISERPDYYHNIGKTPNGVTQFFTKDRLLCSHALDNLINKIDDRNIYLITPDILDIALTIKPGRNWSAWVTTLTTSYDSEKISNYQKGLENFFDCASRTNRMDLVEKIMELFITTPLPNSRPNEIDGIKNRKIETLRLWTAKKEKGPQVAECLEKLAQKHWKEPTFANAYSRNIVTQQFYSTLNAHAPIPRWQPPAIHPAAFDSIKASPTPQATLEAQPQPQSDIFAAAIATEAQEPAVPIRNFVDPDPTGIYES